MPQVVKHIRSAVAGKVPTTAELALGVVAINTNDGKVFIKKDDGAESIIEVTTPAATTSVAGKVQLTDSTSSTSTTTAATPNSVKSAYDLANGKANASHSHGNITNAGAIGSTANLPVITTTSGVLTTGSFGTTANTFCQGNDSRLSDARTPTSHTHGNITNAGAIGSTANLPLITTTSGVITTGSFGTGANTFCQGNDSRLSDARTPTSHTHGNITNDGKIGTTSGVPIITGTSGVLQAGSFGSTAGTFCQGNDSRLSDERTPIDGSVTNAKVATTAAIAGSKISPDFGAQNVTTTGTSTAASFIPTSSTAPANGLYLSAANTPALSSNGSPRLRLLSDGTVSLINSPGIDFSQIQTNLAGMTGETLDHYEEGTFTPSAAGASTAGTGTYSIQQGYYTRVGRIVTFSVYMVWSVHTGTGGARINGLPFTSTSSSLSHTAVSLWAANFTLAANNVIVGYVLPNSTQIVLQQYPVGGGGITSPDLDTAASIMAAGHYIAA